MTLPNIPLRQRLTLVYGFILGVAVFATAYLTHTLVAQNLLHELDDTLSVRSSSLHRALNVTDERFEINQSTDQSLQIPVNEFATPGIYIQLIDQRGVPVVVSSNLRHMTLPIDPVVIADGLAAKPSLVNLAAGQGEHLRVLTMPMIHGQHVVGLLQVATSLHTLDTTLRTLSYQLFLGAIGTWLAALLLTWLVIGRSMRPVAAISALAERIASTGDVGHRIAYQGAKDELGELAATFNRMLERIDRSFAAQRQFVADSSHQLGTPLTVIRGNAELLGQALSSSDQQECVGAIKTEVERMDKVVGDLLTLAQLDARPAIERQAIRLDYLAQESASLVRSVAGDRRIVVETNGPVTIQGDEVRLADLLLNLLHNAVKYSADGTTITVRVATETDHPLGTHSNAPTRANLVVADQGIGIPYEDIDRIFDRFYRVNQAQPGGVRSAGLGLAIVKAIAEAHGASIGVRSELGKGSEFKISFPVAPPVTSMPDRAPSHTLHTRHSPSSS